MIQQKLELQGKIDSLKVILEQEKNNQQMLKEQVKKEEDELKKDFIEKEAKLVSKLIVGSVFYNLLINQSYLEVIIEMFT